MKGVTEMHKTFTILGGIIISIAFFAMPAMALDTAAAAPEPTIQMGTESADTQTFTGTADDDVVLQVGLGGNDVQKASGLAGNDSIYQDGGDGNDTQAANGGAGDDRIFQFGGAGNDTMSAYGDEGNDLVSVTGGAGNDTITARGGEGDDQIFVDGGDGNDTIAVNGDGGNDFVCIDGGAGDDAVTYQVSAGSDVVFIDGGTGTNTLTVNSNNQSFTVRDESGAILHQVGTGGSLITVVNFQSISYISCTYTLSSASKSFTAKGGSATVSITGAQSCPVPEVTVPDWITKGVPTWKKNKGTVKLTASANASSLSRSGTAAIGNASLAVSQAGTACAIKKLTIAPASFPKAGGTGSIAVQASPGDCAWTSGTSDTWVHIASGPGTGNGSIALTVDENPKKSARTGRVKVTLSQAPNRSSQATVKQGGK
jgi:hypothetical protein